jgi:ribosome-associated protein
MRSIVPAHAQLRCVRPGSVLLARVLLLASPSESPRVGNIYPAKVTSVMPYGAFVDLAGTGASGLIHISQLDVDGRRLEAVNVAEGERVFVSVLSLDGGKLSLSRRQISQSTGRRVAPPPPKGEPPSAEQLERLECVTFSYARAGGAGGQNVNKVETKCEVRLELETCPWPADVRERLGTSATAAGELIFVSQAHRTQAANRREALAKLASRVREAWEPPKVRKQRVGLSKRGKATRKEDKRRRGAVKKSRSDSRRGNFD